MSGVPCHCEACDLLFLSRAFGGSGGAKVFTLGSRTLCPRCGKTASILDGVYTFDDDTITMVAGSEASAVQIERLREALVGARTGDVQPDELREVLREQPGPLAALARFVPSDSSSLAAWVSIVLTVVIWWMSRQPPQATITEEQLGSVIEAVVEVLSDDP